MRSCISPIAAHRATRLSRTHHGDDEGRVEAPLDRHRCRQDRRDRHEKRCRYSVGASQIVYRTILLRGVRSAKRTCVLGRSFAGKRLDSLLHAAEHATRSQQLIDAEPRHRVLGAD
jgi:hypothetical protein